MPPVPTASQTPPKAETASERGPAPERSLTQRMEALKRANDIRTRRASLKRDLKAGRVHIHGLLLDPPDDLETAKVFDLLLGEIRHCVRIRFTLTRPYFGTANSRSKTFAVSR